jgi:hypothetical protein
MLEGEKEESKTLKIEARIYLSNSGTINYIVQYIIFFVIGIATTFLTRLK